MSKPVKEMIVADYRSRFADTPSALVIDIRGIAANDNNALRLDLHKKNIRITVIKNTLARSALKGTSLEPLVPALDGPSALAYGGDSVVSVARELIAWAKKIQHLDLKGIVLDGEYYDGSAGVKRVSEFPTREEAQARVVQLILAPAGRVLAAASGPATTVMAVLKSIQEKLERGETIAKAG